MPEFSLARTFRNRGLLLQTGSQFSNSAQGSKDDKYVDDINSEIYNLNADDELLKRYYYDNIRTNKGG